MQTLTDNPATYPTNVHTVSDGDQGKASNFAVGHQDTANRTAWIAGQLGGSVARPDGTSGVQKFRHVLNAAALTALTDLTNGEIGAVDGGGVYQYNSSATATVDGVSVINGLASAGRWLLLTPRAVANGLAPLDSTTKVPAANLPFATIETGSCEEAATTSDPTSTTAIDTFSTTSYVDSGTYKKTVAAALNIGDIIEIEGRYILEIGATTNLTMRIVLLDGASSEVLRGTFFNTDATAYQNQTGIYIPVFARYVMTSAMLVNTCTIKMQGKRTSGTNAAIMLQNSGFRYRVLRP